MTLRHSHVYAKPKGCGRELYAVNIDGGRHDGSSGMTIPATYADFFRSKGYSIPEINILENLDEDSLQEGQFSLIVLAACGGSIPPLATIRFRSIPVTWVR